MYKLLLFGRSLVLHSSESSLICIFGTKATSPLGMILKESIQVACSPAACDIIVRVNYKALTKKKREKKRVDLKLKDLRKICGKSCLHLSAL